VLHDSEILAAPSKRRTTKFDKARLHGFVPASLQDYRIRPTFDESAAKKEIQIDFSRDSGWAESLSYHKFFESMFELGFQRHHRVRRTHDTVLVVGLRGPNVGI
jgi:hypothetical protein